MTYGDLVRLYFERSNALQWYWTLYVVIIGGLLAFSSLRQRPDLFTGLLVTILYCCFAYKNCGAILEVTEQRLAVLHSMQQAPYGPDAAGTTNFRQAIEPTLRPTPYDGARNFHILTDVLTVLALWAMECRRWRIASSTARHSAPSSTDH
jgi:hypothetical protein